MSIDIDYYSTPYGQLILGSYDEKLCLCDWHDRKARATIDHRLAKIFNTTFKRKKSATTERCKTQLDEYFSLKRKQFDIPIALAGTDFQKLVWNGLLNIPFGDTYSYLQLANKLNVQSAVRAVANANGANAISIIIPCHRIIGSNGNLTGYAGGLQTKEKLLSLESNQS